MNGITHGFNELATKYNRLAITVEKNAVKRIREAAINIGSSIIMGTPHDTGKARGNWQTSLDTPILSAIDRLDPTGALAKEEIGTVTMHLTLRNRSIHIINNLPYIHRLNTGWSKKAAPGYIERIVEAGMKQIPDDYLITGNI